MKHVGGVAVGIFGTSVTLAITGGWILLAAGVMLGWRLYSGTTPDRNVVVGVTACTIFVAMHVAFVIALLHYRSVDS